MGNNSNPKPNWGISLKFKRVYTVYTAPLRNILISFTSHPSLMENKVNLWYGDVLFSPLHPPTEATLEEQGNVFLALLYTYLFYRTVCDSVLMSSFSIGSPCLLSQSLGNMWKYSKGRRLTQELLISHIHCWQLPACGLYTFFFPMPKGE